MSAERERVAGFGRLEDGLRQASDWYLWGPYLGERQWGTVREDYSDDGEAWGYVPHDHARSRSYRWGEDAAGLGAAHQTGWTGVVADLIRRQHGDVPSIVDVVWPPAVPPMGS